MNPSGGRVIPSLSKPHTREELENLACNVGGVHEFEDHRDHTRVVLNSLLDGIKRKLKGPAEVIVVTDKVYGSDEEQQWVAAGAMAILNLAEFNALGTRPVIFHCPSSPGWYFSALMRRGEAMQCLRNGDPIPPREIALPTTQ
jgi:hypothetical protein